MCTGVAINAIIGGFQPYMVELFFGKSGLNDGKIAVFLQKTAFFESRKRRNGKACTEGTSKQKRRNGRGIKGKMGLMSQEGRFRRSQNEAE